MHDLLPAAAMNFHRSELSTRDRVKVEVALPLLPLEELILVMVETGVIEQLG